MAVVELDPIFKRGLKLLHSCSKDSAEQLKALLDETLRQKHGKSLPSKDPFSVRRESPIARTKQGSPSTAGISKEKRDYSIKVRDDEPQPSKRARHESPHNTFRSHSPSPTPSVKSETSSKSRKSDDSDSDADMKDLAMEIGINCTVCKSFEQTSGNQLVECQECHSLYHQECHKPVVSHQDVNDPRVVWYCAKCSRSIKKQNTLLASSGGSTSLVGLRSVQSGNFSSQKSSSSSSHSSSARPSPTKGVQRQTPFANLAPLSSRSSGSSASSSLNATSISASTTLLSSGNGRTITGSSTSRQSAVSAGPPGANSILNAERRVHLMKKKAAAKFAERRKM